MGIHLEIVEDMSTDQFILCLRRFIARWGTPQQITSDNAKQFKSARRILAQVHQETLLDDKIQDFVSGRGIKWTLIVELAPWMGGFYERLVGITKRVLRKTLGAKCLTLIQLYTLLTKAEAVVNSRPLVYVSGDDNTHVLVPNDFLTMNPNNVMYSNDTKEEDEEYQPNVKVSTAEKLLTVWKQGQQKLKQFWELWRKEYLLSLRDRAQMSLKHPKRQAHNIPRVGDVVLTKENLPRGRWKTGVIHELVKGRDQVVRSVKVLVSPRTYLHRALNLLYPLECPVNTRIPADSNEAVDQSEPIGNSRSDTNVGSQPSVSDKVPSHDENIGDERSMVQATPQEIWSGGRPVRRATLQAKK